MVVRCLRCEGFPVKVPSHLISQGIEAIIRRREAETGLRFAILASPDDAHPVKAATAGDIHTVNHSESKGS